MSLKFEWDEVKARKNSEKHDVSFEEATTVFRDTFSLTIEDPLHSLNEDRFITVGEVIDGSLVVVSHTERGDTIRIISARKATRRERRSYERGK